ncbi:hypothetical protein [Kitasatospora sp. NBC_01302]|uniref:hypothetical protein n=1 Tax=Kitasatospora sp. NBC_01302 TaxID=2903575 RepID=UPI002E0E8061|nr:hypothetical protein OG294_00470 [Kitasatospora sp. NBC_01302]
MTEFDREQAHRKSKDLSHLKDEVDEKNEEHIEHARHDQAGADRPAPEQDAGGRPQQPPAD